MANHESGGTNGPNEREKELRELLEKYVELIDRLGEILPSIAANPSNKCSLMEHAGRMKRLVRLLPKSFSVEVSADHVNTFKYCMGKSEVLINLLDILTVDTSARRGRFSELEFGERAKELSAVQLLTFARAIGGDELSDPPDFLHLTSSLGGTAFGLLGPILIILKILFIVIPAITMWFLDLIDTRTLIGIFVWAVEVDLDADDSGGGEGDEDEGGGSTAPQAPPTRIPLRYCNPRDYLMEAGSELEITFHGGNALLARLKISENGSLTRTLSPRETTTVTARRRKTVSIHLVGAEKGSASVRYRRW